LFDINWSRKIKVTINGKEYARLEDVPEEFRTLAGQGKRTWKLSGFFQVAGASQPLTSLGVPVALPDGFQLDNDGLERRISWRWFSWHALRGILFAAIFSVPFDFVLYIYVHSPDKSWPAPVLATTLLFALLPAATIYVWIAYLINRTTVRVNPTRISVQHGPIPWPARKDVAKADIAGVVSERVINDSDSSDGSIFQPRELYQVRLMLKNGKTRKLVIGLLSPDHALFIEQQIRKG